MILKENLKFNLVPVPHLIFGEGSIAQAGGLLQRFGRSVLLITGSRSLQSSSHWNTLADVFKAADLKIYHTTVSGEPSPERIDQIVNQFRRRPISVVLAIGGGSVIDCGKAVSAMLTQQSPVRDYLEGVGKGETHNGEKIPFVACPTTAGTGSEATKNAVLSQVGDAGFKKSLRNDNFVPNIAIIDPNLMLNCPPEITAAAGLDAFTQLLEAYVSRKASPVTDALAWSGMQYANKCLLPAFTRGETSIAARAGMSYAALMSGITLANAGLGIVHGLASPLGGFFPIPHGVVCGTLLAAATGENIHALEERSSPEIDTTLEKFARVGRLLSGKDFKDRDAACSALVKILESWTEKLKMPLLSEYGIREEHLEKVVQNTTNKNNPVELKPEQIKHILRKRI